MRAWITSIPILLLSSPAAAGTSRLLEARTVTVPVAGYRTVAFSVPMSQSEGTRLSGDISIDPDTASVELLLLHIDDYLRWRSYAGSVDTLDYVQSVSGSFSLSVPGPGDYQLLLSNRGNYSPVEITVQLQLVYSGTGHSGDPLPSAMRLALLIMMAGVMAYALGSVIARYLWKRRRGN